MSDLQPKTFDWASFGTLFKRFDALSPENPQRLSPEYKLCREFDEATQQYFYPAFRTDNHLPVYRDDVAKLALDDELTWEQALALIPALKELTIGYDSMRAYDETYPRDGANPLNLIRKRKLVEALATIRDFSPRRSDSNERNVKLRVHGIIVDLLRQWAKSKTADELYKYGIDGQIASEPSGSSAWRQLYHFYNQAELMHGLLDEFLRDHPGTARTDAVDVPPRGRFAISGWQGNVPALQELAGVHLPRLYERITGRRYRSKTHDRDIIENEGVQFVHNALKVMGLSRAITTIAADHTKANSQNGQ